MILEIYYLCAILPSFYDHCMNPNSIEKKNAQLIREHLAKTPKDKIPLIVILGPTAVGKTALSIELAQGFGGEVISADSRQIYREMDIGTDKIPLSEQKNGEESCSACPPLSGVASFRAGVPHHMIDVVSPNEEFSAFDFKTACEKLIPEIHARGHVPFLVGGTMLYIDAVTNGFDFGSTKPDEKLRAELALLLKEKGPEALHKVLYELDPKTAVELHPSKVPFVIRAIEKAKAKAKPEPKSRALLNLECKGEDEEAMQAEAPRYHTLKIGLIRPREEIYARINARVDEQFKEGALEKEARSLLKKYGVDCRALTGLGYRQFFEYFAKNISPKPEKVPDITLEIVREKLKQDTRHFAKRQITWWKRDPEIVWFDARNGERVESIADI